MKTSGFTLVETLVVITIVSVLIILISQIFISTTRMSTKVELLKELRQNGDYALRTMTRLIRNASDITCSANGEPIRTISVRDRYGNETTLGCALDVNGTHVASSSSQFGAINLTNDNVSIGPDCATSKLTFTCDQQAGVATDIQINFELSQNKFASTPCAGSAGQTQTDKATQYEKGCVSFATSVSTRN